MSIVSLSLASIRAQPPRAVAETPRPARRAETESAELAERHRGRDSGAGRLEQAIAAALQTLGVGQPAVATAPAAVEAAPAETAVAEPTTLQSAVHEFAQALYAALRDVGGGRGQGNGLGQGHGHAHGHHDDHGWRGRGYGSLSNRLENLAATLGSTAAAPAAPAGPATPPVNAPVTVPDSATADAAAAPAETTAATRAEPAPATTQPSALLAAFTQLQALLQPAAAGTTAADPAAALKQFLQALAQGLRGAVPEGDGLRSGNLVNLSA